MLSFSCHMPHLFAFSAMHDVNLPLGSMGVERVGRGGREMYIILRIVFGELLSLWCMLLGPVTAVLAT